MENKIIIYPDPKEFLEAMEKLQDEYNKKHKLGAYTESPPDN